MEEISIFDIAGPAMVGPSSSHTAGACKIGQFARALFHGTPSKVTFYLHGSFGEVYKGHATDKALVAGILKLQTSDPRIKESFDLAKKRKMKYKFIPTNLGEKYHPNTVEIVMENKNRTMSVIGSSVGGGMIEIVKIDDFDINIKGRAGKYLSLVVCHENDNKTLMDIQKRINSLEGISISAIQHKRYKDKAISVLSLEGRPIKLPEVMEIEKSMPKVEFIRSLSKLETQ